MANFDEEIASAPSGGSGTVNPAALDAAISGPSAGTDEARAFLREQEHLTKLQGKILHEQHVFELSHLRWRRFNDQMKGALQIMIVALGALVVIAIATAMWNASQADGIVVEAFSVPPSFAANGMGGDVVADDLTNKIAAIRDVSNGNSFAHSGKDINKDRREGIAVEIPETGISFAQAWRLLKDWLGHERTLNGNIRNAGNGKIVVTVALAGDAAGAFAGPVSDLDKLEQEAAEHVFSAIDPGNYVLYLDGQNRGDEAYATISHLAQAASDVRERADLTSLWSAMTRSVDVRLSLARARYSLSLDPGVIVSHREIMVDSQLLGHDEEALNETQKLLTVGEKDYPPAFQGEGFAQLIGSVDLERDGATGDFRAAQDDRCFYCSAGDALLQRAEYDARAHDLAQYRSDTANALVSGDVSATALHRSRYFADAAAGDWHVAAIEAKAYKDAIRATTGAAHGTLDFRPADEVKVLTFATPMLAEALARSGEFAAAQQAIATTSLDCYHCVRMRGIIAALEGNQNEAEHWFAVATKLGPSLPFAFSDWGAMLLQQGKYNAAIEKFHEANLKGPHFADPIEMWGEALIQENRSDLALAKFEEATKYAPNWGRLHLEWGKALLYAAKKDESAQQFAVASRLDLSSADAATLKRASGE